ncbi:MAG: response regulator transcription factor [Pseudomonadota bacterium]|nr:response regulator transcription factor [Pseudomonadota bacterium]
MNILLIEDDAELSASLLRDFEEQGCAVERCSDGSSGLINACEPHHQVIVLDRMLPELDGLSLLKALRSRGIATPVIYLTTMSGIDDRVAGLDAGADDYLTKPFAFAELLARVKVLSRRAVQGGEATTRLSVGTLDMDLLKRSVERGGVAIPLLPQEFRLLEYFMRHPDRVITRTMLLQHVWNIHFDPLTSVVESHISRLRTKINLGCTIDAIQTIRGVGYKFVTAN